MAVKRLCHATLGGCSPECVSNATLNALLSLTLPASGDEVSVGGVMSAADVPTCPRDLSRPSILFVSLSIHSTPVVYARDGSIFHRNEGSTQQNRGLRVALWGDLLERGPRLKPSRFGVTILFFFPFLFSFSHKTDGAESWPSQV